jgi:hypothetical protein
MEVCKNELHEGILDLADVALCCCLGWISSHIQQQINIHLFQSPSTSKIISQKSSS